MLSGNQTILYMKNLQPLSDMGLNLADVWKDFIQEKIIWEYLPYCELFNSQDVIVNPLTLKILFVILLAECQMILIILVWRIWYRINY